MPPLTTGGVPPPPIPKRAAGFQIHKSEPYTPPPPRPTPKSLSYTSQTSGIESALSEPLVLAAIPEVPTSALVQPTSLPPAICRTSRSCFQTSLQNWDQAKVQYQHWLSALILQIGQPSQIFQEFGNRPTYDTVIKQLLSHVGPSTLDLYSRSVNATVIWMKQIGTSWDHLTIHNMVVILHFSAEAARSDVPSIRIQPPQLLRGLRWLAKTALMQSLMDILNNYLMGSFLKGTGQPKDRKEAIPIPFAILVLWEQAIVSPDTPGWITLLLGGLLLAVWASLRFADLQRTELSSLCLAQDCLRGICRLTKTSRNGQPFGIYIPGFIALQHNQCWVVHWLRALQKAYYRTAPFKPDFVIPTLNSYHEPSFSAPLSYTAALKALRWAAQTPWTRPILSPQAAHNLTLHSLKVTFLAASAQLRLPAEARRLQGHHLGGSVQLYSRDDVVDALWLQRQVSLHTRQEWRPLRPLQRGGQQPAPEPQFDLPCHTLPENFDVPWEARLSMFQITSVSADTIPLDTTLQDSDSDVDTLSSCSSSSSSSDDILLDPPTEVVFIQNGPAGCCHIATSAPVLCDSLHTLEYQGKMWKANCGVPLKPSARVVTLQDISWPCKRAACRHRFDAISVLHQELWSHLTSGKKKGGNMTPLAVVSILDLEQPHVSVTFQSLNFVYNTFPTLVSHTHLTH